MISLETRRLLFPLCSFLFSFFTTSVSFIPPAPGRQSIQGAFDQVPDASPVSDCGAVHDGGYAERSPVEPHVHGPTPTSLTSRLGLFLFCDVFTVPLCVHVQSFLKHKDAKPLRDVLASNPNRFVPLLVPAGTAATVRPGSPSTTTARLDLQFQAIKVP